MKISAIVLIYLIQTINAEPYYCCPGEPNAVIRHTKCPDGNVSIARQLCGTNTPVVIPKDVMGEAYKIDASDNLVLSEEPILPREQYCLARIIINDEEIEVAVVCTGEESSQPYTIGVEATAICCIISTIFLFLTLAVYVVLPELRDLQGKCLMSSVMSLFMSYLLLAIIQLSHTLNPTACLSMAALLYFWFLCVFFWLNIVSFNVWRSVSRPKWLQDKKHIFYIYNIYGWGVPLIMLIIAVTSHHVPGGHLKPGFAEGRCWFGGEREIWAYFYGPISVLLGLNILMFIFTAVNLFKNNQVYKEHKIRSQKFKFLLYLKLFFIMGICWTFEPLSMVLKDYHIWIVTDYINALQGILIFLLLVVFRKRVRKGLASRGFCCSRFTSNWAIIKDEECEELEEADEESVSINNPVTFNTVTNNEVEK